MKILFVGGTGIISSACSALAAARGFDVTLLNRGASDRLPAPAGVAVLHADARDPDAVRAALGTRAFDAVIDFIAFTPEDIRRDIDLFAGRTRQFVFISSASAYQKPPRHYLLTEDTPLANPHWEYSRQKIAAEEALLAAYRQTGFPAVIVRPSLTYGPSQIPLILGSWAHPYTLIDRMRRGAPVIVPGDGTSLWSVTWNGDFAKGLVGLLGREQTIGHAFHITTDEVLTWDQIVTDAAHAAGVEPKIVHIPADLIAHHWPAMHGTLRGDKIYSGVLDNTKIKRWVPEFAAGVLWSEGVRRSLAWFDSHPDRKSVDEAHNAQYDRVLALYQRAWE